MTIKNNIWLWCILFRTGLDVIGFIIPGIKNTLVKLGWVVDDFWVDSIRFTPIMMCFVTILVMFIKFEPNLLYTSAVGLTALGWVIAFIKNHRKNTLIMWIDAVSWFIVFVATCYIQFA